MQFANIDPTNITGSGSVQALLDELKSKELPFEIVGRAADNVHLAIVVQRFTHTFPSQVPDLTSYCVRVLPTLGRISAVRLLPDRVRSFRVVDQEYSSDGGPALIYDLEPARCRLIVHLAPTRTTPLPLEPPAKLIALEQKLRATSRSVDDLVGSFKNG